MKAHLTFVSDTIAFHAVVATDGTISEGDTVVFDNALLNEGTL